MMELSWVAALGFLWPSAMAFAYSFTTIAMYTGFHEYTWSEKGFSVFLRLVVLAGALGLCWGDMHYEKTASLSLLTPLQVGLIWLVSAYLILDTRYADVVGGIPPQEVLPPNAMEGKIVLITGSNAGIGKETARQLAHLGAAKIILACRSPKRGQEAMDDLRKDPHTRRDLSQFLVLACDLSDYSSIRNAVQVLQKRQQSKEIPKIDVLVLNAGVMMGDQVVTKDGHETMMQANVLGHFLLLRLLLDAKLMVPSETNPPRVLHLTSSTHQIAIDAHGGLDLTDLHARQQNGSTRQYSLFGQYAQTKLANILIAKELPRRYPDGIISLAIHPGIVRTEGISRNMPWFLYYGDRASTFIVKHLRKTVPQGAWTSVYAAAAAQVSLNTGDKDDTNKKHSPSSASTPPIIPNGSYLQNCKVRETHPYTNSETDARRLWDMCEKMVGLEHK